MSHERVYKFGARSVFWHPQFQDSSLITETEPLDEAVKKELFFLLNHSFGITLLKKMRGKNVNLQELRDYMSETQQIIFSGRELESLYHLCQGKTAKLTAREMGISPRTVETYIESIRAKSGCQNKLEIITRFGKYFSQSLENYPGNITESTF
jgi:DNA-binding CsgD family transcriptional regulator